jgi:hypothetical protein
MADYMKGKERGGFTFICMLLVNASIIAQTADWKSETTKDGKVTVSYMFSESMDKDGKKYNVLEFVAVTAAPVPLESCRKVLMDDSKHKAFMEGTENTRRIKDLPGGEWVTYYFLNSRWPMPDSDVITRYKLE